MEEPDPKPVVLDMPVDVRNLALPLLAFAAGVVLLRYAEEVLVPVVLAVLVSYALWPLVTWLEKIKVPRTLAAAIVLSATTFGIGWAVYTVRFQAINLVDQIPDATRLVRRELLRGQGGESAMSKVQEAATAVQQTAEQAGGGPDPTVGRGVMRVRIEEPAFDARKYVRWGSMGIVGLMGQLVLIFFLVFFLLQSGDLFKRKIVKIAGPTLSKKKITVEILDEINRQIGGFLFVRAAASLAVAIATWLALRWLGRAGDVRDFTYADPRPEHTERCFERLDQRCECGWYKGRTDDIQHHAERQWEESKACRHQNIARTKVTELIGQRQRDHSAHDNRQKRHRQHFDM